MLLIRQKECYSKFHKYCSACMAVCSLPVLGVQHSAFGGQMPMALQEFVLDKAVAFNGGLAIPSPNENSQQTCAY